jgi:hypothetical protein
LSLPWDDIVARAAATLSAEERATAELYLDQRVVTPGQRLDIDGRPIHRERAVVVVFADLEPAANWGHACRYLLVDRDTGAVEAIEARFPPFLRQDVPTLRRVPRDRLRLADG